MGGTWQAAEARHNFSEVIDKAVTGDPQFIKRRDGREVVVVSREYFDKTKPNLKNCLLSSGYADDAEDAFDVAMRDIRTGDGEMFAPRDIDGNG